MTSFKEFLEFCGCNYTLSKQPDNTIEININKGTELHISIVSKLNEVLQHICPVIKSLAEHTRDTSKLSDSGYWKDELEKIIEKPKFTINFTDLYYQIYMIYPLTVEEIKQYCLNHGTCISYDDDGERYVSDEDAMSWLTSTTRIHQLAEAVRTNLDLIDYDEWMDLETLLYGRDSEDLPSLTAGRINQVLWEDLDDSAIELVLRHPKHGGGL